MSIELKYSDSLNKSNSESHISNYSVLLFNAQMQTNDEVRRLNLERAIRKVGSAAKLAEAAKTSPAYLSQIKNRTPDSKSGTPKTMGDDMARRIETAIGMPIGWMDIKHTDQSSADVAHGAGEGAARRRARDMAVRKMEAQDQSRFDRARLGLDDRQVPREQPFVRSVVAFDLDDGAPEGMVLVPESRIEFSAGDGRINYGLVDEHAPAAYRREWFQKHGINPDRVRRFRVTGDSMEPMLFAGDTILVCTEQTEVVDGRLYALRYGDQLRVKYLSKRIDGTLVLRSINPAYKDEEVPAELANEHITIIGRVRDRSGTGGL